MKDWWCKKQTKKVYSTVTMGFGSIPQQICTQKAAYLQNVGLLVVGYYQTPL